MKDIPNRINAVIEEIRAIQNAVSFDTTDSSETSLDMAVQILAEVRGMVEVETP